MEIKSGIANALLSLPQGGGALRDMGGSFQPDLFKGTGTYTLPIELPKAQAGFGPELGLQYLTSQGSGPFGMGWTLAGLMEISRSAMGAVASYGDEGADKLALNGEPLVALGGDEYRMQRNQHHLDIRRTSDGGFRVRNPDGSCAWLGTSSASRVQSEGRVFQWLVEREEDAHGNRIDYSYRADGTVLYAERIAWSIYSVTFVYEERPDLITDGRAGFLRQIRWRCTQLERRVDVLADNPVTSRFTFSYVTAPGNGASLLSAVHVEGIGRDGETETAPALRFKYSLMQEGAHRLHHLGPDHPLLSLRKPSSALVDMNADGLPDLLETADGIHTIWENEGGGKFRRGASSSRPSPRMDLAESGVTFIDRNGNGRADMVRMQGRISTAISNSGEGQWEVAPTVFEQQVAVDVRESATRLLDLSGDGVTDVLQSTPEGFLVYCSQGVFGAWCPRAVARTHDLKQFPDVDLNDPKVRLADMTGDGLFDIVYLDNGCVWYWPSLGYGAFGPRVVMARPPVSTHWSPERVFLADVDGDGVTDLVVVDGDRVLYWLNQSGRAWSEERRVSYIPCDNRSPMETVDLLGTGLRGLLWQHQG